MSKVFIISISLFSILIFGNFAFLPHYRDLRALRTEINEKNAELASIEEYFAQIEFLSQELQQYPEELGKIEFALPANPDFAPFFAFLQRACSENGLIFKKINSFKALTHEKGEKTDKSEVRFEASGDFNSLLNFLTILEKSVRMIEVVKISFSSPEQDETFSFKITAQIHSY